MKLFFSEQTRCSVCHSGIFFTDLLPHNTGVTTHYFDKGHYDVTGKVCPEPDVSSVPVWDTFKADLQAAVSGTSVSRPQDATSTSGVPYKVKVANVVKGDVLWIRKTPSVKAASTGCLQYNDNNAYTIIAEQNGWGKLKSGIGWINLKYTKRV